MPNYKVIQEGELHSVIDDKCNILATFKYETTANDVRNILNDWAIDRSLIEHNSEVEQFVLRAGFRHGYDQLDSQAKCMVARAVIELTEKHKCPEKF